MKEVYALLQTVAKLRDPDSGCPWDLKQTHQSLTPYLLEEAYEAVEAIESGDFSELKQELGDVLLQVVLHAQLAAEAGHFAFSDVAQAIDEKMVRRHPHVFANQQFANEAEQKEFWEAEKQREKGAGAQKDSVLSDMPSNLPALLKAEKIQERVSRTGFDWDDVSDVMDKIEEELNEVRAALSSTDQEHVQEEVGDLLFAVVNLARFTSINAESALSKANRKFTRRFQQLEQLVTEHDKVLTECSLDELEEYWSASKPENDLFASIKDDLHLMQVYGFI